ncbi:MAG TPA: hypothetical protein VH298_00125, partial [Jatrophihabitans sp.]|nr:hypothetical protein [Jatrophihabitans sp.]
MIRPTAPTSSPIETCDSADDPDALALALTRSVLPFDVGCAHLLPGHAGAGRCQLWIGHQGEHAVMFVRDGIRLVRSWHEQNLPRVHDGTDCRYQPWVHGFPRPAWHEGCPMTAHELVPGRSATSRTVADAMVHRPKVESVTSTVAQLRRLFVDPHVHAALIAVDDVLITVVDRDEVHSALPANTPATSLGTLLGRTVEPTESLETARQQLMSTGRRR